jgi:hypothetical protein
MKLSAALVACNENPKYLEFWPIVKYAWWHIVGIPAVMVYVGDVVPEDLKNDPAVIHFPPVPGWPTATQAQVIRLFAPGLLQTDGAVVISDMDIVPLQREFFVDGFGQFKDNQFVSLHGINDAEQQVYMCYVGALPSVWRSLFLTNGFNDVRLHMTRLAEHIKSDGLHAGQGWLTDQLLLYKYVKERMVKDASSVGVLPLPTEFSRRLDRARPEEWVSLTDELKQKLVSSQYVDFHMPSYHYISSHVLPILDIIIQAPQQAQQQSTFMMNPVE